MSNIYISIDGVDGVGKTTIAQALVRKSIFFELYSSPGSPFKETRKEVDNLNNVIGRYAFYTLSCINDCKNISNLLQYSNVISDRSFISTTVYHSVLNNNIKKINKFILESGLILKPHKSILLLAKKETRISRLGSRKKSRTDIVGIDDNQELQERIQEEYKKQNNLIWVETDNRSTEDIVAEILTIIS
jgi:thymidylate kinase